MEMSDDEEVARYKQAMREQEDRNRAAQKLEAHAKEFLSKFAGHMGFRLEDCAIDRAAFGPDATIYYYKVIHTCSYFVPASKVGIEMAEKAGLFDAQDENWVRLPEVV